MLKLHGFPKKNQTPMNSERYATKRFTLKSTFLWNSQKCPEVPAKSKPSKWLSCL